MLQQGFKAAREGGSGIGGAMVKGLGSAAKAGLKEGARSALNAARGKKGGAGFTGKGSGEGALNRAAESMKAKRKGASEEPGGKIKGS
jgi:hypothetical protein